MEKYFIGESSTNKTRRMLEEAKKNGATVVCKNIYRMKLKAECYGISGLEFEAYGDIDCLNGRKIAIDELGDFFKHYFGTELDSFTMTID